MVIPPPLLEEQHYYNMGYFKNRAHWKIQWKSRKHCWLLEELLREHRCSFLSDVHIYLCASCFGINTPIPCYAANYKEYVFSQFFLTSLLHNTLLCFYFNPLFLLTSLQIMFIVFKFPVHTLWRVLLTCSYISKQKKKVSTPLFYSQ